jgi:hypothetical protein
LKQLLRIEAVTPVLQQDKINVRFYKQTTGSFAKRIIGAPHA